MRTDDDPFSLTGLFPHNTGLPMTVWIGRRSAKNVVATIRVNMVYGDASSITNTAVVVIEPKPRLITGYLSERDITRVTAWIETNSHALLALWRGEIDGAELGRRLNAAGGGGEARGGRDHA